MASGEIPHSTDAGGSRGIRDVEHWHVTLQQGRELSRQGESIARQESALASLAESVDRGHKDAHRDSEKLFARIDEMAKPKPPVQWVPLVALTLMLLGAFGTVMVFLFSLTTENLRREGDLRIAALIEREDAILATMQAQISPLREFDTAQMAHDLKLARELGYEQARREALDQQVQVMDQRVFENARLLGAE